MNRPTREGPTMEQRAIRHKPDKISTWGIGRTKKKIDDSLDRFFGTKSERPQNSPQYDFKRKKKP